MPMPGRCSATWKPCSMADRPTWQSTLGFPSATRSGSSTSNFDGSWNHRRGNSGHWSPIQTGSIERLDLHR